MMSFNRRQAIAGGSALIAGAVPGLAAPPANEGDWARVARLYETTPDLNQLENGNWGIMSRPVLDAYTRNIERVNRDNSFYARRGMGKDLQAVQERLAATLGVGADEIALTRNATEALKTMIAGYNRLKAGDAVLIADLDYGSIQASMRALAARQGARVVTIDLPEPASHQGLIDAYAAAFAANPAIRLVLLTHVSHRTGLVVPVRAIADLARAKGIDVIVDAAHSVGQMEFTLPALGCDFIGMNLHKWLGAPVGVGAMYIARSRLDAIDFDPGDEDRVATSIASRIHVGTADMAAQLTVPAALDFHYGLGAAAIEARLRALRNRWTEPLRALPGVEILTPSDPRLHAGITSFRLKGLTRDADNIALAKTLLERFRIFTVHRTGVARGACIRVTPALFTSMAQVDALAAAIRTLASERA